MVEKIRLSHIEEKVPLRSDTLKEKTRELIEGKIKSMPPGSEFKSELPGIRSINFIKAPSSKTLNIVLVKGGGKIRSFSLLSNGSISGTFDRKGLKFSKEDLQEEIWVHLRRIGLDFWHGESQEIFEDADWPQAPETSEPEERGRPKELPDDRRIEFLQKQPDVLFGFYGKKGFKGYHGFTFKNFIVLENPDCGNAAYFIDFERPLTEEEIAEALTPEGRKRIIEKHWKPHSEKGKWELFKEGHERMIHPKRDMPTEEWMKKMQDRLNERNELPNRDVKLTEKEKKVE